MMQIAHLIVQGNNVVMMVAEGLVLLVALTLRHVKMVFVVATAE
jgi:hypothetical protein